jgi:flagellar export protein FliJ
MKKFQFSLEALLKIKGFSEKKCKTELSELLKKKKDLNLKIKQIDNEINNAYDFHNTSDSEIKGSFFSMLPDFLNGKRLVLIQEEKKIRNLDELIELKKKELASLMGEVKRFSGLKEKEFINFKKVRNKKLDEEVEENYLMSKDRVKKI